MVTTEGAFKARSLASSGLSRAEDLSCDPTRRSRARVLAVTRTCVGTTLLRGPYSRPVAAAKDGHIGEGPIAVVAVQSVWPVIVGDVDVV